MKRGDLLDAVECLQFKNGVNEKVDVLKNHVLRQSPIDLSDEQRQIVKNRVTAFYSNFQKKIKAARTSYAAFKLQNQSWLEVTENFFDFECSGKRKSAEYVGRPKTDFDRLSESSKRRRSSTLCDNYTLSELGYAYFFKLRSEGKFQEAALVRNTLLGQTEENAETSTCQNSVIPYTLEEAVALLVDARLTVAQYKLLRKGAVEKQCPSLYPSYEQVLACKKECYPDDIEVSFDNVIIKLQSLLNHSATRIARVQASKVQSLPNLSQLQFTLVSKWGMDGSSGYSMWKVRVNDPNFADTNLFLCALVPLQLYAVNTQTSEKISVWHNTSPSSPRTCRPIMIKFCKESEHVVHETYRFIQGQIKTLVPTTVPISQGTLQITHDLRLTMIDGKISHFLTGVSSNQVCDVCRATPKDMMKLERLHELTVDSNAISFLLSILHAWIRCFEYLWHIALKLPLKKWRQDKNNGKQATILKKHHLKLVAEMKLKTGLNIDIVRPGGAGNSNDGNTARRFFSDPALVASILKIDEGLIRRFSVILRAISSCRQLDADAMHTYCLDTYKLCISLYPWYYMPSSVHKLLFHIAEFIKSSPLPLGFMSEEPQESLNKSTKRFRVENTRKSCYELANEDLVHSLLVNSDPVISAQRNVRPKAALPILPEHSFLFSAIEQPLLLEEQNSDL